MIIDSESSASEVLVWFAHFLIPATALFVASAVLLGAARVPSNRRIDTLVIEVQRKLFGGFYLGRDWSSETRTRMRHFAYAVRIWIAVSTAFVVLFLVRAVLREL